MKVKAGKEKILLVLLPFWTPLIPPMGIVCLKTFLHQYGYEVKTVDANTEYRLRKTHNIYFNQLEEVVPEEKQGNFYSIGAEVLQRHLMAHSNYRDEKEYIEVVKLLVFKTFYIHLEDSRVLELNRIIAEFYAELESYWLELLEKEKPRVLGLSVYSGTLPASLFAFKLTKENYPHIRTVMGGGIFGEELVKGSPNLEQVLENTPYIDKFIIGEGEQLFLKFLQDQLPGSQRVYALQDNDGEILDLASVDVPDFSDFNPGDYPFFAAYASRGCPFQCSFCAETVNWGKFRKKSGKQVFRELLKLYQQHGLQLFLMCDSLLNPIVTELAKEFVTSDISIYWDGYLRADQSVCNVENTLLWRQGGFYRARLGVESGSPKILDMIDKKITPQQIKQAVSSLAAVGIKTTTYWVIGHPGETREDFRLTLQLIEELKDDIYEAECTPFVYNFTGQVKSDQWLQKHNRLPLYPGNALQLLLTQTWVLDCQPSREERYRRVSEFVNHCTRLGIPNPYSLEEICRADERWKRLHPNSVPPFLEFNNKENCIDESKHVKKKVLAHAAPDDGEGFGF